MLLTFNALAYLWPFRECLAGFQAGSFQGLGPIRRAIIVAYLYFGVQKTSCTNGKLI